MEITDKSSACAWLAAWGGKPRRKIIEMAIDSQVVCMVMTDQWEHRSDERAGHEEAHGALQEAYYKLFGRSYFTSTIRIKSRASAAEVPGEAK